ncbi:MAG: NeuD/PglB/VioB family sugar acetyltransferase [Rhodospirillaceae bacterium]
MLKILIAGAGGFGREVLTYALDAIAAGRLDATVAGFLDDTDPDLSPFGLDIGVVGCIDAYAPADGEAVVVAIGNPAARAAVAAGLEQRGARFVSVIHPLAWVAPTAQVGAGCIVAPFATVGPWAKIGRHVVINTHAGVGHDVVLGDAVEMAPHAVCNGWTSLGPQVFVGSGAVLTARLEIGAGAKVAAGAVVYSRVPEGVTAMGNPARMMPLPKD